MIKHALTAAAVASIMALTAPAFGASPPVPMEEIPTQSIGIDVPLARSEASPHTYVWGFLLDYGEDCLCSVQS